MRKLRTIFLVLILITIAFFSFRLNVNLHDPKTQLQLLAEFNPKPRDMTFQGPMGWIGYSSTGYVISLATVKNPTFGSTEYLVITRANSKIFVDLIDGAGPENSCTLETEEAHMFLKKHSFDLTSFDMQFEALSSQ